jgi:hypothetical protein
MWDPQHSFTFYVILLFLQGLGHPLESWNTNVSFLLYPIFSSNFYFLSFIRAEFVTMNYPARLLESRRLALRGDPWQSHRLLLCRCKCFCCCDVRQMSDHVRTLGSSPRRPGSRLTDRNCSKINKRGTTLYCACQWFFEFVREVWLSSWYITVVTIDMFSRKWTNSENVNTFMHMSDSRRGLDW